MAHSSRLVRDLLVKLFTERDFQLFVDDCYPDLVQRIGWSQPVERLAFELIRLLRNEGIYWDLSLFAHLHRFRPNQRAAIARVAAVVRAQRPDAPSRQDEAEAARSGDAPALSAAWGRRHWLFIALPLASLGCVSAMWLSGETATPQRIVSPVLGTGADDIRRLVAAPSEASAEPSRLQRIVITTSPPEALVVIDGEPRGRTPFDGRLPVVDKARAVVLILPGYQDVSLSVSGARDVRQRVLLPPKGQRHPTGPRQKKEPAPPKPVYDPKQEKAG